MITCISSSSNAPVSHVYTEIKTAHYIFYHDNHQKTFAEMKNFRHTVTCTPWIIYRIKKMEFSKTTIFHLVLQNLCFFFPLAQIRNNASCLFQAFAPVPNSSSFNIYDLEYLSCYRIRSSRRMASTATAKFQTSCSTLFCLIYFQAYRQDYIKGTAL